MAIQQEIPWEYDKVTVGQNAQSVVNKITRDKVKDYLESVRPSGHASWVWDYLDDSQIPATMIFSLAPKNRSGIASNNGFTALEEVDLNPRSTPFAKCEAWWYKPLKKDDTITSVSRVHDKYERRGNKFVTFRVEARNQQDSLVSIHDYTSIFEFKPTGAGSSKRTSENEIPGLPVKSENKPIPKAIKPEQVHVSGAIPIYSMSAGTLAQSNDVEGRFPWGAAHGVGGVTIMAYIAQQIETWCPSTTLYNGGKMLFKAISNFKTGDSMKYSGKVVNIRTVDGIYNIDCTIKGHNQLDQLTGIAEVSIVEKII